MLKWAVGGGDGGTMGGSKYADTPVSTRTSGGGSLSYHQSLRQTAARLHLLPPTASASTESGDLPILSKRAVVRNLSNNKQAGKENTEDEPPREKRPRDFNILGRLRTLGQVTDKPSCGRQSLGHDRTDKPTNGRGPLGDVTNQSPVPSPRATSKGTPSRSRSRTRKSLPARQLPTADQRRETAGKDKCTSCNSTPRRKLIKRTPKRKKHPVFDVSPLKPSDLCIDYSPQLGDSLLALRRRLEDNFPYSATLDNPLYYTLKPGIHPVPHAKSPQVSPIARNLSWLRLNTPDTNQPKITPPTPFLSVTNKKHDITNPQFLENTLIKTRDVKTSEATFEKIMPTLNTARTISLPTPLRALPSAKTNPRTVSSTIVNQVPSSSTVITSRIPYSNSTLQPLPTPRTSSVTRVNTLPTPRLTPDLVSWLPQRSSVSSCSDASTLGETWDSHRLHTLLAQQGRAQINSFPVMHDSDTPPMLLETKSLIDLARNNQISKAAVIPQPCNPQRSVINVSSQAATASSNTTWTEDASGDRTVCVTTTRRVTVTEVSSCSSTVSGSDVHHSVKVAKTLKIHKVEEVSMSDTIMNASVEMVDEDIKKTAQGFLSLCRVLTFSDSEEQEEENLLPARTNSQESDCPLANVGPSSEPSSTAPSPQTSATGVTEVTESPLAMVERKSRSRRCLLYAQPTSSSRSQAGLTPCRRRKKGRTSLPHRGEVKLALYNNCGLLTVHVISATNLPQRDHNRPASAFVKICLIPRAEENAVVQRTNVRRPGPSSSSGSNLSSAPLYRFDQKFSLEVPSDEESRVLVSVWLRPRAEKHRKSECVGCMSFGVRDVLEQDARGTFLVLSQSAGRTQNVAARGPGGAGPGRTPSVMAEHSDSSVEEVVSLNEDVPTPRKHDRRRSSHRKSNTTPIMNTHEDSSFLRHLELEVTPEGGSGRTPFTSTRKLTRKPGTGFGFSVAWTQPPRVERVEAGLPADKAGLRPGDYVIFVESHNVVTMPEEEILSLIRLCGNQLTLEVYRRLAPNGVVLGSGASSSSPAPQPPPSQRRMAGSMTDCSAATSLDLRRRLQLPQVTFSTEAGLTGEEARRRAVYQLLQRLQGFSLAMQFGVERFLLPLGERKDLLNSQDHLTLFQNSEELLMMTEELLEQLLTDDPEHVGATLGRIYLNKIQALASAYRRYCLGLKKADCLLVQKAATPDFLRVTSEPPIPRRRPDLTTFIHKPLEHYRETLKLLMTILKHSKAQDEETAALSKVVQALQVTYRDITSGSGLMEPDGDGRPLLSLQDLESRLVFTKCKPIILNSGGRQWIFGGDLSLVERRSTRPYWALLFTDLLILAKVSRDRVLFVTEEPLSLIDVTQACFSIRKKDTEFRLILDSPPPGATDVKGSVRKNRRRSVALRAPTAELKAVWQNLLQRQIIYLNTVRGATPNASPLDSPAEQPSLATMDSPSRLQASCPGGSQKHLDQLIEQKCRLLGKSGLHKGSALHLQQWMTGQLGASQTTAPASPDEPEPEVWSPGTLRRRSEQHASGGPQGRAESRCEEIELLSDVERSPSRSTDDSPVTVRSGGLTAMRAQPLTEQSRPAEKATSPVQNVLQPSLVNNKSIVRSSSPVSGGTAAPQPVVAMCRQCVETCAQHPCPPSHHNQGTAKVRTDSLGSSDYDSEEGDRWEPLPSELGISLQRDPFFPQDEPMPKQLPSIAVVPPTPDTLSCAGDSVAGSHGFEWDTAELEAAANACALIEEEDEDDDEDFEGVADRGEANPPYRALSNSLRRYGTLTSLENLEGDETDSGDDTLMHSTSQVKPSVKLPAASFTALRDNKTEVNNFELHNGKDGLTHEVKSDISDAKKLLHDEIESVLNNSKYSPHEIKSTLNDEKLDMNDITPSIINNGEPIVVEVQCTEQENIITSMHGFESKIEESYPSMPETKAALHEVTMINLNNEDLRSKMNETKNPTHEIKFSTIDIKAPVALTRYPAMDLFDFSDEDENDAQEKKVPVLRSMSLTCNERVEVAPEKTQWQRDSSLDDIPDLRKHKEEQSMPETPPEELSDFEEEEEHCMFVRSTLQTQQNTPPTLAPASTSAPAPTPTPPTLAPASTSAPAPNPTSASAPAPSSTPAPAPTSTLASTLTSTPAPAPEPIPAPAPATAPVPTSSRMKTFFSFSVEEEDDDFYPQVEPDPPCMLKGDSKDPSNAQSQVDPVEERMRKYACEKAKIESFGQSMLKDKKKVENSVTKMQDRKSSTCSEEASGVSARLAGTGEALVQVDAMSQSLRGWTPRASSIVAERARVFERISQQSKSNHVSIERFLPNPFSAGLPIISSIPRTVSSSCFIPGNDQPLITPLKTPPQSPPKAHSSVPAPKAPPVKVPATKVTHTTPSSSTLLSKSPTPSSAIPPLSKSPTPVNKIKPTTSEATTKAPSPKTPSPTTAPATSTAPVALPRLKKQQPRTVPQLSRERHPEPCSMPAPATVHPPLVRHTVVMGTCATLKAKAPAVPVRAKIGPAFKSRAPPPPQLQPQQQPQQQQQKQQQQQPPPVPTKPLELVSTARPRSPVALGTVKQQVTSPDSSVSDKEEWGTPEGGDPDDEEEELSSTQDIVAMFPCVGDPVSTWSPDDEAGSRSWSPEEDLTALLAAPPRVFPRRRLEPLYEEEDGLEGVIRAPRPRLLSDSSSSGSSTPDLTQGRAGSGRRGRASWGDACADSDARGLAAAATSAAAASAPTRASLGATNAQHPSASSGLLHRLKLASSRRRGWGGIEAATRPPRASANKLLGLLANRSEESGRGLMRLFGNNAVNREAPAGRPDQDKILDRRFWKQLKRRRSGSMHSSSAPIAV